MRALTFVITAFLSAALSGAASAGDDLPVPDFKTGRPADPDFNLNFEMVPAKGGAREPFVIAAGAPGNYAFVRLGPDREASAGLAAADKQPQVCGVLPAVAGDGRLKCLVRFRSGRFMSLAANGREVARVPLATDPRAPSPTLAFAGGGFEVAGVAYQKIDRSETVLFSDDFTRQGAGLGDWKAAPLPEAWRVNADPHPDLSASPFAMECAPCAAATTARCGQAFWDDYRVRAAVCVLGSPGAGGLAFNLSEGGGYLLRLVLEGAGSGGAGRAELVELAPGGEKLLASRAVPGSPRAWFELELASVGGCLRAAIDGNELAKLSGRTDLLGGRIGLWSSGAAAARFDDVWVEALELPVGEFEQGGASLELVARRWWLPPPVLPAYFQNDHTMRAWARLEDDYVQSGGGCWQRARLAGDMEIAWKSRGARLAAGQLILALAADGQDFNSGYRLVADLGAASGGGALLTIFERDQRVAGRLLPANGAGLEQLAFSREAGKLVARVGSAAALAAPDTLKLPAGRAGARALGGWNLRAEQLGTTGANLLDEVFARAPVDWRSATGDWEVASRWKCNPEFTWMIGRARRQLARLDLKRPVKGEFRAEVHFAVGMAERPGPFYDWPTNLTLSLSTDPADPTAGYVFAFGGVDLPSRILRAGRVLAEGSALLSRGGRNPDGGYLHSHWFAMRAERKGARLALWGDGEKLCECTDPEPLAGAEHLAVWTRGDNGAVIPRIRLEAAEPLGPRRSPFAGEAAPGKLPGPAPDGPFRHFANRDGTNGAMLAAADGGRVLRLVRPQAGGTFAAAWAPPGGMDLAAEGWLAFNWRTSPGAKVNLYLVRGGRFYRVQLTGPAERVGGRYFIHPLGAVPEARAGTAGFQRFSFDLGAALAAAEPALADLRVEEIRIGNYEVEDAALLEGFTGNKAGEWVELSGWKLGPGPEGSMPATLAVDAPGATVAAGARTGIRLGADPRSFVLEAGGRELRYDAAGLRYDAFARALTLDPRAAGLELAAGANPVTVRCRGFAARPGPAGPADARFTVDFDPTKDRRAPAAPRLVEPAPLDLDDFERDAGSWETWSGLDGAQLIRDAARPAPDGGRWCLLGQNQRCGGNLGAMAGRRPLDVKRYPLLSFDYCIEPLTTVNLILFTARGRHDIELTDEDGGADTISRVPEARADGKWHHAVVDLSAALAHRGAAVVRQLGLADLGPGNSTTASCWRLDNWALLPAVNGTRPVRFRWEARDESGIAGSGAVLDRRPDTVPEEKVTAEQPELVQAGGLAEGLWYLHVRCRDRAGNWGPAAHWPFKVVNYPDSPAPRVAAVRPAAREAGCPGRVEVTFAEGGPGLSAHDLELAVGERSFRPGDEGVTFIPAERRLIVDLADLEGRLPVPAGEVRCRVTAADYAGTRMEKPFEWTWKLELAKDAAAPAGPKVLYLPSDRVVFEDFEQGQGEFAEWRRGMCWRALARTRGEAGGGYGHLVSSGRRWHDNNNEIQLWPHPIDPERHSYLAFDYRMRSDASFSFMLEVSNEHHTLGFNPGYWGARRRDGEMAEAQADGAWHRVEIDLRRLRDRLPKGPDGHMPVIQKILATFGSQDGMEMDNFVLGSVRGRDPEFVWEAPPAPSGIAGYAWCLDDKADTVPPEKLSGAARRAAFKDVAPGTWWFHLRARSGAGLWGQPAHVKIVIEK